jgi:Uma2 family endonuclease
MQAEVTKKLFTVDEYYEMARVGILKPEEHVELIDGEIIQMSPIGHPHAVCVNRINQLFVLSLHGRAVIQIQNPIQLNDYTEPEPDVVVLKPRSDFYANERKIVGEYALLIVEVSDTTLRYDRDIKVPRYAAAGVPEAWIVNLSANELLVYRSPTSKGYASSMTLHRSDSVSPVAFPDVVFKVEELLG